MGILVDFRVKIRGKIKEKGEDNFRGKSRQKSGVNWLKK